MKKRFAYWIGLFVLAILSDFVFPKVTESEFLSVLMKIFGILGIVLAIVLNTLAGRTLKLYGHKIKTKKFSPPDKFVNIGIFSCMRHPGQFGNIILIVSISLLSGKILAFLFSGWLAFFGVLFILFVEESEAIKKFGVDYCEYIKNTKPFSLDFVCIKEAFDIIFKKGEV